MPQIRSAREDDLPSLLDIWRRSVRATHDFLSQEDFRAIEADVAETYLPNATLWVMADADDLPLAFLGLSGAHVDSLFVDPAERGKGHGSRLIGHARRIAGRLTLDVNEQNAQALGFYRRMGFRVTGRSERDGDGRPYPLLRMELWR